MSTHYGIRTEYEERTEDRDRITAWSGAFMSTFEAKGTARTGSTFYTMYDYSGKRFRVNLPEGVTAPRTDENYEQIDRAISERYAAHNRALGRIVAGEALR